MNIYDTQYKEDVSRILFGHPHASSKAIKFKVELIMEDKMNAFLFRKIPIMRPVIDLVASEARA